jgi:sulfatase maturation enzyme AslB (radical SAM superfamily)
MEKEIEAAINYFLIDLDQRKLEVLDRVLLSLLLRKELLLFEGKDSPEAARIGKILSRYHDYRALLLRKSLKSTRLDKGFLISRIYPAPTRLILLVTHSCQLKCRYCRVRKFSSSMSEDVMRKAVDLLFTSNRNDLQLQFFGGEPLLRFDLVRKAVEYAEGINKKLKRKLTFILTTNGIALTPEKIGFFKKHKFIIECSIDGEIENQLRTRRARSGADYYAQLVRNLKLLFKSGVEHYSISVLMPSGASSFFESFKHLVKMGFKRLQVNYALGVFWPREEIARLFEETDKAARHVKQNKNIEFINMSSLRREPVVLNAELTVDCDGGIYLESGICLEEDFAAMKKKFQVGDIERSRDINLLASSVFQNFYRLSRAYADVNPKFRKIILNNIFLGKNYEKPIKRWI